MIDESNLLKHIAIIMDGNGRWAQSPKGKIVYLGTAMEPKPSTKVVEAAARLQIEHLTLYAFSTENWNRPKLEVSTLMDLLIKALRRELNKMIKNNIQLRSIGDISKLPTEVEKELLETIEKTSQNTGMILTLALNYGLTKNLPMPFVKLQPKLKII